MALTDVLWGFRKHYLGPADKYVAITHGDTSASDIPLTRSVYVGVGGNITAVGADDVAILFKGATTGSILPIRVKRINATGTAATDLVALY